MRQSRLSFAESSPEYDAQMVRRVGSRPRMNAARATDASSDLPERGGTLISNRRTRPASTSARLWLSARNAAVGTQSCPGLTILNALMANAVKVWRTPLISLRSDIRTAPHHHALVGPPPPDRGSQESDQRSPSPVHRAARSGAPLRDRA